MIKTYKIKGTYWRQGDLMYPEALEVFGLLRGRLKGAFSGMAQLGQKIDELAADKTLDKIFAIAIKPHNPTPLHRMINERRCARLDITSANIITHMTMAQVAQAALDFFFINADLIKRSLNTRLGTISLFRPGPTVLQAILSILKLSSISPGAITLSQKDSPANAPPT